MKYLLLLFFISGYSQVITYSGNVTESGLPVPGANICIKNTSTCTISDFDGNYTIQAKVGDELVISYLGMQTQYIKVTGNNPAYVNGEVKPILNESFTSAVKQLNDSLQPSEPAGTTSAPVQRGLAMYDVVNLKKNLNNVYTFVTSKEYHKLYLELYTEFIVGVPMRERDFQNTYAQGRSLNGSAAYQGPETDEVFSWGPHISTLQTADYATPYYPDGDIINRSGTGNPVAVYDRNRFYTTSYDTKTTLSAKLVMPNFDNLKLNVSYRNSTGSIPTAENDELSTTLSYNTSYERHSLTGALNFNSFENQLSNFNFIYNKAIFANAITPAHFNNEAGVLLPNGSPRNFSRLENNPYYLLSYNRDTNVSSALGLSLEDEYKYDNFTNTAKVISQFSSVKFTGGNIPLAAQAGNGDYSSRNEEYSLFSVENNFEYERDYRYPMGAKINFSHQNRNLRRAFAEGYSSLADYPGNFDSGYLIAKEQERTEVNLQVYAEHGFNELINYDDYLLLNASADISYSSTYKNNVYAGAAAGFKWRDLLFDYIDLFGRVAASQYEPSLQNNNLNFNSLRYRIDQFKQMRNDIELFTPNSTTTTRETLYTGGLNYNSWISVGLELYYKKVSDQYAPVQMGGSFAWQPAVDYYQKGLELSATLYHSRYNADFNFSHNLNFTTYKNKVTGLAQNRERIAIAGFADVNKNYITGQPLGVIVGSAYERDANNNIVIGSDGFPLVADDPAILGDPNPDFLLGLNSTVNYKDFSLTIGFDWSQGGELWNGTSQTLNYYGVSQLTAEQRNITGYVFEGVTQTGLPNTQPVSFYDTSLPVNQNRWVRYGVGGVAEDAIEDATYYRLNNITLSYSNDVPYGKDNVGFTVSAYVNNVFIISESDTAFAGNTLFNSAETSGLDYFNSPMLRSYGLSVAVKF
jgi:hypothetical protein